MPATITKIVTVDPTTDEYTWNDINGADGNWITVTETQPNTWTFVANQNSTGQVRTAEFRLEHTGYGSNPSNPSLSDSFTITQNPGVNVP